MTYTNWNDTPLLLTAADIAGITGLSKPTVYTLMKRSDFPSIQLSSKRTVIPRDAFKSWLERQAERVC